MLNIEVTEAYYRSGMALNVFAPSSGKSSLGCVFYLHGGAWLSGSKLNSTEVSTNLAQQGYTVVCPNYTLTSSPKIKAMGNVVCYLLLSVPIVFYTISVCTKPSTRCFLAILSLTLLILTTLDLLVGFNRRPSGCYPENLHDTKKALDWTIHNIPIAKQRLFIMGHSAGAHLAALVSNTTEYKVTGVVLLNGVYLYRAMDHPVLSLLRSQVFHDKEEAFPDFHVKGSLPPHLLCSAQFDFGLQKQARRYTRLLEDHGTIAAHVLFDKKNHYSIRRQWDTTNKHVLQTIVGFMRAPSNIKKSA